MIEIDNLIGALARTVDTMCDEYCKYHSKEDGNVYPEEKCDSCPMKQLDI